MSTPPSPQQLQAVFEKALAHHREGQLDQAMRGYDIVLSNLPRHADAFYLRGLAAQQAGQAQASLPFLEHALRLAPKVAPFLIAMGNSLLDLGRAKEALQHFNRALVQEAANVEALLNRGVALQALGQLEDALAAYAKVLALDPKRAEALHNRGRVLQQLGRMQEAGLAYEGALRIDPGFAEARNNLGTLLQAAGHTEEALAQFDAVLARDPRLPSAHGNRAAALAALGRHEEALAALDTLLALTPEAPAALANKGMVLAELSRWAEAESALERAFMLAPGQAEALNTLGTVLLETDKPEAALARLDQALALAPGHARALANRGTALTALHRLGEAVSAFEASLAAAPAAETRYGLATALLLAGDLPAGFAAYESRKERAEPAGQRALPAPLWTGAEPLPGKTIFLHWEQGLGDTLMAARYAPLLAARGAKVILSVQAPLLGLLRQLEPAVSVIGPDEVPPAFDLHCPLLSLPLACATTIESIPPSLALAAEPARVAAWGQRLPPAVGPRIGLAWSGNAAHRNDRRRSIALARLAPLLGEGFCWIGLQKELREADAAALAAMPQLHPLGQQLEDFADTAALLAHLDLVITVDTAIAHLAGAMGKPVWLLLPATPDWRWLLDREDSPWYPTARLFRQEEAGNWEGVLAQVAFALRQRG